MSTESVNEDGARLEHDIDRLVARLYTEHLDLSVGRQALTWGDAKLFSVADIWTSFSPFELDLSEKRGVDSVRALTSLGMWGELEALIVDRARLGELSGGARLTLYLDDADTYFAAAKNWQDIWFAAGISAEYELFGFRAEASWTSWDLDEEQVELPRLTLGCDWFGESLMIAAELHYNGLGAQQSRDYMETLGLGQLPAW